MLFGASAPLAKRLLADAAPQAFAGLLYLGSGIGLGLVSLISARRLRAGRKDHPVEARLTRVDLPWLAAAITAGGVMAPVLLMRGLQVTSSASASLLLNLEGVFTALIAWLVFHENVDKRIAMGFFCIILGGAVIGWQSGGKATSMMGPLLVAAACLAWGIDNNLTQKVSGSDPTQIAMLKGLIAGTVNSGLAIATGAHWPGGLRMAAALLLGFASYGVSLVLYVLSLRALGTARTGAYFSLAPFAGAVISVLFFRETVTLAILVAGGLMAAGVWLHLAEHHEHEHSHSRLEHQHWHVHDAHHQHAHGPNDPSGEPHTHWHVHEPMVHSHPHYPDIHHRHVE
jgi:drug/metabolite transporter (DMT)-like permease